jgi:hypothetical protein
VECQMVELDLSNPGKSPITVEAEPVKASPVRCGLPLLLKAFLLREVVQLWVEASAGLNRGLNSCLVGPIEGFGVDRASEQAEAPKCD